MVPDRFTFGVVIFHLNQKKSDKMRTKDYSNEQMSENSMLVLPVLQWNAN